VKFCTKFRNSEVLGGLFFKTVLSALLTASFSSRKHNNIEVAAVHHPVRSPFYFNMSEFLVVGY